MKRNISQLSTSEIRRSRKHQPPSATLSRRSSFAMTAKTSDTKRRTAPAASDDCASPRSSGATSSQGDVVGVEHHEQVQQAGDDQERIAYSQVTARTSRRRSQRRWRNRSARFPGRRRRETTSGSEKSNETGGRESRRRSQTSTAARPAAPVPCDACRARDVRPGIAQDATQSSTRALDCVSSAAVARTAAGLPYGGLEAVRRQLVRVLNAARMTRMTAAPRRQPRPRGSHSRARRRWSTRTPGSRPSAPPPPTGCERTACPWRASGERTRPFAPTERHQASRQPRPRRSPCSAQTGICVDHNSNDRAAVDGDDAPMP